MSAPDASILIVSYRTRDLLDRCLASIPGASPGRALEAVVVDNDSRDGTDAMLRDRHPEVTFVPLGRNLGFAGAMNEGLPRLRGRWVVWLNPDCEMAPGSLDLLIAHLESHPRTGAVGPTLVYPDGRPQPSAQAYPGLARFVYHFLGLRALARVPGVARVARRLLPGGMVRSYLEALEPATAPRTVDWISGACIVVRREASDRVGMLDDGYFMYCEDLDWCHRLRDTGWDIQHVPGARVVHHVGGSGPGNPVTQYHYYASLLRYFRRYRARGYAWARPALTILFALRGTGRELARLAGGRAAHPWWRLAKVCWSPDLAAGVPR